MEHYQDTFEMNDGKPTGKAEEQRMLNQRVNNSSF